MKLLGLDIGTTTVSAVVVENGEVLSSVTLRNDAFLPGVHSWERLQDPHSIRKTAMEAVSTLLSEHPDAGRIGVTGQMHGIVYLNSRGIPVSPLYTWQDGRGDQPCDREETYAARLSRLTGYPLSTGYGMVTHFYHLQNGSVPETAVVFCTIHDYIAMWLSGNLRPVTEASDAASFGLFDVEKGEFDLTALQKAGIDPGMLPPLAQTPCIGQYRGIPVWVAIGDNQASFLGAAGGQLDAMLVNVGTGSQFSAYIPTYMRCPGLETRPFPGGGYLLVGASLCGGRTYALLENFLRSAVQAMTGTAPDSCYKAMDKLLSSAPEPESLPKVSPLFQGTRQDPGLRGSITGLSTDNFTPRHLIWATLEGMADELYEMYRQYLSAGGNAAVLIGSGNGLRKNSHLQSCFSRLFGQPLVMWDCKEEAATGAALFAAGL